VQRGCDYRCTYCIVPTTRGSERSRRLTDVVREVESVVTEGMTEVVLLGQTVNSYHDGEFDFADLLRAVGRVDGVRRIRFTSPHPNDFSDRVIAAIAEVDAVCEHVHLPMQSGSTRVLKRMLRRYTREGYLDCVAKLRTAVPGLSLTTDVIVGFPGETDEDFEETLEVVREVGFADGFTFKFSPRDGTPATRMPAELTVSDDVASERLARLVETIRGLARASNMTQLGRRHEVLIERQARRGDDVFMARTRDFKTVMVPGDASMLGSYVTVEITGTTGSTFTGQIVGERKPLPLAV
jgi:tRNA-2-methylthio-N6-dimethylallyladenosine synthase